MRHLSLSISLSIPPSLSLSLSLSLLNKESQSHQNAPSEIPAVTHRLAGVPVLLKHYWGSVRNKPNSVLQIKDSFQLCSVFNCIFLLFSHMLLR